MPQRHPRARTQKHPTALKARSARLNSRAPDPYSAYPYRPASNAPAPPHTRLFPPARNSPNGEFAPLTRRSFARCAKRGLCDTSAARYGLPPSGVSQAPRRLNLPNRFKGAFSAAQFPRPAPLFRVPLPSHVKRACAAAHAPVPARPQFA